MHSNARFQATRLDDDTRLAGRREIRLVLDSAWADGAQRAVVHNISTTGILIESTAPLAIGDTFTVELPELGAQAARVVWRSERFSGCAFAAPIPAWVVSAALLRSPALAEPPPAAYEDRAVQRGGLPLRTKFAVIVGSSVILWTIILGAITAVT